MRHGIGRTRQQLAAGAADTQLHLSARAAVAQAAIQ